MVMADVFILSTETETQTHTHTQHTPTSHTHSQTDIQLDIHKTGIIIEESLVLCLGPIQIRAVTLRKKVDLFLKNIFK